MKDGFQDNWGFDFMEIDYLEAIETQKNIENNISFSF